MAEIEKYKQYELNVAGSCDTDYKVFLLNRVLDLGLQDNMEFHEYFPDIKICLQKGKRQ